MSAASVAERSVHASSLPLDEEAAYACKAIGATMHVDEPVMDRVERELVESRFTGLVCVRFEEGYRLGMVVIDGTVLGAWLAGPPGRYWGEEALAVAEALPGGATVSYSPRSAYEL